MELFIFARFHAQVGREAEVAAAIAESVRHTRKEDGCLLIEGYASIRDARLFYIHSRFRDEDAFELHATLPHVVKFLATVEPIIDHPLDVTRARPLYLA